MSTLTPNYNQVSDKIIDINKENSSLNNLSSVLDIKGKPEAHTNNELLEKEPGSPLNTSQSSSSEKDTTTKESKQTSKISRLSAIKRWRKSKAAKSHQNQSQKSLKIFLNTNGVRLS